jgi:hypothetical protein
LTDRIATQRPLSPAIKRMLSRCACRVGNAEVCTENMVEIELAEWLEKDVDAQINSHWCRRSS